MLTLSVFLVSLGIGGAGLVLEYGYSKRMGKPFLWTSAVGIAITAILTYSVAFAAMLQ